MAIIFTLDEEKINDLQYRSILRTIETAKHAHMTDIEMRINGTNERFEADWIKHLKIAVGADEKLL